MKFLAFLVLAVALVSQANAQTAVTVRSGEHADFSRLVFYYGAPVDWTLGRVAGGYGLNATPPKWAYNLSGVFDFIPKSRILGVRQEAGTMVIDVTCQCHADAFEYQPGILVVDIKDGPAPAKSLFEASLVAGEPGAGLASATDKTPDDTQTLSLAPASEGGAGRALLTLPVVFPDGTGPGLRSTEVLETSAAQNRFGAALAEQLGRAMSQGLATPAFAPDKTGSPENPTIAQPVGHEPAQTGPDHGGHVEMHTAIDRARSDVTGELDRHDPKCLPADDFALWTTPSERTPDDLLADARAGFLTNGDTPGDDAVMAMAQAYAYLGFGAEARLVLAAYPQPGHRAQVLSDVASLLDDPAEGGSALLQAQVSCDSPGALWGLLALGATPPPSDMDEKAILRTASALPVHLRRYLGPVLSERLRALGRDDAAARVRGSVLRAGEAAGEAMVIEIAKAQTDGHDPATAKQLKVAASGNSELSAQAEAELLQDVARVGVPVPSDKRDEVMALIHQTKGTAAGTDLLAAFLDALAAAGQHSDALGYLVRVSESEFTDKGQLGPMLNRLVQQIAAEADDGTFLVLAATYPPETLPAPLADATATEMSNRLLRLGFADLSRQFLPPRPTAEVQVADPARQIALAESALRSDRPVEALARVVQIDSPEARAVRLRALEQAGAYREAGALLQADGDAEAAARLAWIGGDWETAAALLPDGSRKLLAEQMRTLESGAETAEPVTGGPAVDATQASDPGAPAVGTPSTLLASRDLITRSRNLRAAGEVLLAAEDAAN